MTIINTKTADWEITFKADKLRELTSSQQKQAQMFFEMMGDALFVYNILSNETFREALEFHYTIVLAEFTHSLQNAVMNTMQQQLWSTPLTGDLAYETLFGLNLLDEIKNLAVQEQGLNLESLDDGSPLFQQLFTALDEIVEDLEDDQSSFEEDDEDDEEGKTEDDDFTKH